MDVTINTKNLQNTFKIKRYHLILNCETNFIIYKTAKLETYSLSHVQPLQYSST